MVLFRLVYRLQVLLNIFVFCFQHGSVNAYLKPMLQRDFISLLPKQGLDHLAENILSFLDAKSLAAAQRVCKGWLNVISEGESFGQKIIIRKCNILISTIVTTLQSMMNAKLSLHGFWHFH